MQSWNSLRHVAACTLLVPPLVGGCAATGPLGEAQDQRADELAAAMDQCVLYQAQASAQLAAQEQQLAEQSQQLGTIREQLEALTSAAHRPSVGEPAGPAASAVAGANEACADSADSTSKLLVGQLEQVWMQNLNLSLPARIDTGAETSSLDARNIELFERNSRRWVRFEILHPETGEPLPLERRLKRMVTIMQSNLPDSERRPVIKLGITIGTISQTAEFTLSDRSHLEYQVLVGRNILKDVMVVDVSKENIAPYVLPEELTQDGSGAP